MKYLGIVISIGIIIVLAYYTILISLDALKRVPPTSMKTVIIVLATVFAIIILVIIILFLLTVAEVIHSYERVAPYYY